MRHFNPKEQEQFEKLRKKYFKNFMLIEMKEFKRLKGVERKVIKTTGTVLIELLKLMGFSFFITIWMKIWNLMTHYISFMHWLQ
jgi:hypothetical protein